MRTMVKGGWIVGWEGDTHVLFRDGVVVYEDAHVVHVGSRFDGRVDRTIDAAGKLVSPGFIDTRRSLAASATSFGRPRLPCSSAVHLSQ